MQLDNPARHEHCDSLDDLKHPAGLQDRFKHVTSDGHTERLDLFEDNNLRLDDNELIAIVA